MAEKLTTLAKRLRPFIIGMTTDVASSSGGYVGEGPGIDLVTYTVGFGGDTILQYHTSGVPVAEFAFTAAGLTAGLAALSSGEWLRINAAGTIAGDFTIPAGTELMADSRSQVTIAGQITGGDGAVMTRIKISHTANDANALYGVQGPTTGTFYIYYCDISAVQSGAGNAYAIGAVNGVGIDHGHIVVRHSKLYGSSVSGSGYAGRSTAGIIYSRHNDYYGSTDRWVMA